MRELRTRRGMSQFEVAFDADVHDQYVSQVERGTTNTSFAMLLRIVRALGYDMVELIRVYDYHRRILDPITGRDGHSPPPEVVEYLRRLDAEDRILNLAGMARGRIRSWT